MELQSLYERALLWRGGARPTGPRHVLATGHAMLDAALPGQGLPRRAVTEILAGAGVGAVALLLPALAQLLGSEPERRLALIAPPHQPYAPALAAAGIDLRRVLCVRAQATVQAAPSRPPPADRKPRATEQATPRAASMDRASLWALEQCLRSGACAAVLAWFDTPPVHTLRRLQLAAEAGDTVALLYYPPQEQAIATPAALRLAIRRNPSDTGDSLIIDILKSRGGWPAAPVTLAAPHHAMARHQTAAAAA